MISQHLILLLPHFFLHFIGAYSTTFTLVNKCTATIWPATLTNAGTAQLTADATGFSLAAGDSYALSVPDSWSGRVWARTLCSSGPPFSCATGDCGSGSVQCSGRGAAPPATLAEFTLAGAGGGGLDFYDVSLVDGFNLPVLVRSAGGSGNCSAAGCTADLNGSCPPDLRVTAASGGGAYGTSAVDDADGGAVACKSACDAFGDARYCCSGAYATPDKCRPSVYSEYFKRNCPGAYSYAYDDASSTFTCSGADYVITFCPTSSATDKSSGSQNQSPYESPFPPSASSSISQPPILGLLLALLFMLFPNRL